MASTSSALRSPPFRPTWEVGASLGVHMLLLAAIFVTEHLSHDEGPLIDPASVMVVQAVALPKQTTRLPDKPMRTPDPPKVAPQPVPVVSDTPPPPPTASDMVLHKDDAPKPPPAAEQPKDRTDDRQALLDKMKREQLVRDASAPIGPENKVQTSPDGVDPKDAIFGVGSGTPMEREAAAWWSKARPMVWENWTPLPGTIAAHPELSVQIKVKVAPDGTLSDAEVYKKTSDPSYDRSAVLAVIKTGHVTPPPEKYAEQWSKYGTIFVFAAKDR